MNKGKSAKKTRVLMLAYTTYSIDARIRREAETLAAHGYKVRIIVPREGKKSRKFILDGVKVIELDVNKYRGKSNFRYLLSYVWFTAAASWKCLRFFFRKKMDIFHVHNMPNFLIFAGLIPRLLKTKTILDIHDSMPETYSTKFGNSNGFLIRLMCWEEAICCRLADRVICVNHPQKDVLAARGIPADKIVILLNVPDNKRFNPGEKEKHPGKDSAAFNLVYHGTQARRLGVDFIIRAIARLADEIPGIKFHNLGDGDDLNEFIRLSSELGIAENIYFSGGNVPIEELPEILAKMDIGVVANRNNPATELMLPVKMLEYIAYDIPVIVPRLKAIQYYFDENMVTFFEPEDVDSLASAILELYKDPGKRDARMKEAGKFIARYGWENHQFDLINLYNDL